MARSYREFYNKFVFASEHVYIYEIERLLQYSRNSIRKSDIRLVELWSKYRNAFESNF